MNLTLNKEKFMNDAGQRRVSGLIMADPKIMKNHVKSLCVLLF